LVVFSCVPSIFATGFAKATASQESYDIPIRTSLFHTANFASPLICGLYKAKAHAGKEEVRRMN